MIILEIIAVPQLFFLGMPLEDLYWRCRDAFLTNSEATLRTQLTEFRDHKLINMRKVSLFRPVAFQFVRLFVVVYI